MTAQNSQTNALKVGAHAVVIGGSMAGLLTARVLADHFDRVTLVERDEMNDAAEVRKGQPQARHLHALLGRGLETMGRYFPDLPQALQDGGAVIDDVAQNMRWYCYGDYRVRFRSGITGALVSRPFLEWHTRRRVKALPNLVALDASAVEQLLTTDNRTRVTGVSIVRRGKGSQRETLAAGLVVDASGSLCRRKRPTRNAAAAPCPWKGSAGL